MKTLLISISFLFILSCNQFEKKKELITSESGKTQIQTEDTTLYKSYLKNIFGDKISRFQSEKDSVLFYDDLSAKYSENELEKHISLRFNECRVSINSFELNSDFKLLKKNSWFEEAIPHEDLFYGTDKYILVFDCLKYCGQSTPKEYFIETLRIYKINDYLEISNKSHSVAYALKAVD